MGDERPIQASLERLIERARALGDEDRRALAGARRVIDETFHVDAWRAAHEVLSPRVEAYVDAWARIGSAFIPDRLRDLVRMGSEADPAEVAEWQEVARLVRIGIDDAVLALLTSDSIPPPDVRELYAPWKKMLETGRASRR